MCTPPSFIFSANMTLFNPFLKIYQFLRLDYEDSELAGKFTYGLMQEVNELSEVVCDTYSVIVESLSALEGDSFSAADLGFHFKHALLECESILRPHIPIPADLGVIQNDGYEGKSYSPTQRQLDF